MGRPGYYRHHKFLVQAVAIPCNEQVPRESWTSFLADEVQEHDLGVDVHQELVEAVMKKPASRLADSREKSSFFAAPYLMLVMTVSTCEASSCSQLLDLCSWRQRAIANHPVFHWCLLQQSAFVNHLVFRSSMMDAWCDSEHLYSIQLFATP